MSFIKYGDSNKDGVTDISDVISVIDVFKGAHVSEDDKKIIDTNNDGQIDISDVIGVIDIFKNKKTYNTNGEISNSAVRLKNIDTVNKKVEFFINTDELKENSSIAGLQIYVSGVSFSKRIGETGYEYITEGVHSSLSNWIVATNTIKQKGLNNWSNEDLSIIYLETDTIEHMLSTGQGEIKVCDLHYTAINAEKLRFYSKNDYKSMVVSINNESVKENNVIYNNYEN